MALYLRMVVCLSVLPGLLAAAPGTAPSFEADIRPLLEAKCVACHGAKSPQGKLDLRTAASVLSGGTSGPSVVPGAASRSLLLDKVVSKTMPPGKDKLTEGEVDLIRTWIDKGAAATTRAAITEHDVLPIFQIRCVACHGKRKQEGGLDLRTMAGRLKGGKSGPAIIPGKPEESLLIKRIVSGDMPPAKMQLENSVRPATEVELEKLKQWIAGVDPVKTSLPPAPAETSTIKAADRQFWSFLPPKRPGVPDVRHSALVSNPIDAFLLQKLEAKKLSFSPEADRLKLLRRAWLDLIGMPPAPADIEAYQRDTAPGAYERMIDGLLASPHYGERWGRHWLDLAGYSDSEGFGQDDGVRRYAWRYRDYVVRSFNADKSYAQFLTEQIAGDELADYTKEPKITQDVIDRLAATGFLRTTPDPTNAPERGFIAERMNIIADEVEVLTSSVMGLTVGCARCHDHKYDPIPQRDYYRLSAILHTAYDPYDWLPPKKRELPVALESEWKEANEHNAPIEAEIKKLEASVSKDGKDSKNADGLKKEIADAKARLKPTPHVRVLMDTGGEASGSYLLRRGDAVNPGERVEPGVPSVLQVGLEPYKVTPPWPGADSSGRRLALARWLTQPNHPLTSRVIVNQIWMRHFGRGIVASPSNFGRSGMAPSHPELLDWLATEFVNRGWGIKSMHRLIMTSRAYRQDSLVAGETLASDPENILLSRMPLRRMDAEALYDSILMASGRLDAKPFGVPADLEVKPDKEVVVKGGKAGFRRGIYVLQRRQTPVTLLEAFDQPPMTPNCLERRQSNVATQALQMMNGSAVWDHSRYMAGRIIDAVGEQPEKQIEQVYLRTLSRRPAAEESAQAAAALKAFAAQWPERLAADNSDAPKAWTARWMALAGLCHTILNSAEFVFID